MAAKSIKKLRKHAPHYPEPRIVNEITKCKLPTNYLKCNAPLCSLEACHGSLESVLSDVLLESNVSSLSTIKEVSRDSGKKKASRKRNEPADVIQDDDMLASFPSARCLPDISFTGFTVGSWTSWKGIGETCLAADNESCEDISVTSSTRNDTDVVHIRGKDIGLYGVCPRQELFSLVVCNQCNVAVKPQALERHYGQRHQSLVIANPPNLLLNTCDQETQVVPAKGRNTDSVFINDNQNGLQNVNALDTILAVDTGNERGNDVPPDDMPCTSTATLLTIKKHKIKKLRSSANIDSDGTENSVVVNDCQNTKMESMVPLDTLQNLHCEFKMAHYPDLLPLVSEKSLTTEEMESSSQMIIGNAGELLTSGNSRKHSATTSKKPLQHGLLAASGAVNKIDLLKFVDCNLQPQCKDLRNNCKKMNRASLLHSSPSVGEFTESSNLSNGKCDDVIDIVTVGAVARGTCTIQSVSHFANIKTKKSNVKRDSVVPFQNDSLVKQSAIDAASEIPLVPCSYNKLTAKKRKHLKDSKLNNGVCTETLSDGTATNNCEDALSDVIGRPGKSLRQQSNLVAEENLVCRTSIETLVSNQKLAVTASGKSKRRWRLLQPNLASLDSNTSIINVLGNETCDSNMQKLNNEHRSKHNCCNNSNDEKFSAVSFLGFSAKHDLVDTNAEVINETENLNSTKTKPICKKQAVQQKNRKSAAFDTASGSVKAQGDGRIDFVDQILPRVLRSTNDKQDTEQALNAVQQRDESVVCDNKLSEVTILEKEGLQLGLKSSVKSNVCSNILFSSKSKFKNSDKCVIEHIEGKSHDKKDNINSSNSASCNRHTSQENKTCTGRSKIKGVRKTDKSQLNLSDSNLKIDTCEFQTTKSKLKINKSKLKGDMHKMKVIRLMRSKTQKRKLRGQSLQRICSNELKGLGIQTNVNMIDQDSYVCDGVQTTRNLSMPLSRRAAAVTAAGLVTAMTVNEPLKRKRVVVQPNSILPKNKPLSTVCNDIASSKEDVAASHSSTCMKESKSASTMDVELSSGSGTGSSMDNQYWVQSKQRKLASELQGVLVPLSHDDREFDADVHCGSLVTETGKPCTSSLTCKYHSLSQRRTVIGRSKPFDDLLSDYRLQREELLFYKLEALQKRKQIEERDKVNMSHRRSSRNSAAAAGLPVCAEAPHNYSKICPEASETPPPSSSSNHISRITARKVASSKRRKLHSTSRHSTPRSARVIQKPGKRSDGTLVKIPTSRKVMSPESHSSKQSLPLSPRSVDTVKTPASPKFIPSKRKTLKQSLHVSSMPVENNKITTSQKSPSSQRNTSKQFALISSRPVESAAKKPGIVFDVETVSVIEQTKSVWSGCPFPVVLPQFRSSLVNCGIISSASNETKPLMSRYNKHPVWSTRCSLHLNEDVDYNCQCSDEQVQHGDLTRPDEVKVVVSDDNEDDDDICCLDSACVLSRHPRPLAVCRFGAWKQPGTSGMISFNRREDHCLSAVALMIEQTLQPVATAQRKHSFRSHGKDDISSIKFYNNFDAKNLHRYTNFADMESTYDHEKPLATAEYKTPIKKKETHSSASPAISGDVNIVNAESKSSDLSPLDSIGASKIETTSLALPDSTTDKSSDIEKNLFSGSTSQITFENCRTIEPTDMHKQSDSCLSPDIDWLIIGNDYLKRFTFEDSCSPKTVSSTFTDLTVGTTSASAVSLTSMVSTTVSSLHQFNGCSAMASMLSTQHQTSNSVNVGTAVESKWRKTFRESESAASTHSVVNIGWSAPLRCLRVQTDLNNVKVTGVSRTAQKNGLIQSDQLQSDKVVTKQLIVGLSSSASRTSITSSSDKSTLRLKTSEPSGQTSDELQKKQSNIAAPIQSSLWSTPPKITKKVFIDAASTDARTAAERTAIDHYQSASQRDSMGSQSNIMSSSTNVVFASQKLLHNKLAPIAKLGKNIDSNDSQNLFFLSSQNQDFSNSATSYIDRPIYSQLPLTSYREQGRHSDDPSWRSSSLLPVKTCASSLTSATSSKSVGTESRVNLSNGQSLSTPTQKKLTIKFGKDRLIATHSFINNSSMSLSRSSLMSIDDQTPEVAKHAKILMSGQQSFCSSNDITRLNSFDLCSLKKDQNRKISKTVRRDSLF